MPTSAVCCKEEPQDVSEGGDTCSSVNTTAAGHPLDTDSTGSTSLFDIIPVNTAWISIFGGQSAARLSNEPASSNQHTKFMKFRQESAPAGSTTPPRETEPFEDNTSVADAVPSDRNARCDERDAPSDQGARCDVRDAVPAPRNANWEWHKRGKQSTTPETCSSEERNVAKKAPVREVEAGAKQVSRESGTDRLTNPFKYFFKTPDPLEGLRRRPRDGDDYPTPSQCRNDGPSKPTHRVRVLVEHRELLSEHADNNRSSATSNSAVTEDSERRTRIVPNNDSSDRASYTILKEEVGNAEQAPNRNAAHGAPCTVIKEEQDSAARGASVSIVKEEEEEGTTGKANEKRALTASDGNPEQEPSNIEKALTSIEKALSRRSADAASVQPDATCAVLNDELTSHEQDSAQHVTPLNLTAEEYQSSAASSSSSSHTATVEIVNEQPLEIPLGPNRTQSQRSPGPSTETSRQERNRKDVDERGNDPSTRDSQERVESLVKKLSDRGTLKTKKQPITADEAAVLKNIDVLVKREPVEATEGTAFNEPAVSAPQQPSGSGSSACGLTMTCSVARPQGTVTPHTNATAACATGQPTGSDNSVNREEGHNDDDEPIVLFEKQPKKRRGTAKNTSFGTTTQPRVIKTEEVDTDAMHDVASSSMGNQSFGTTSSTTTHRETSAQNESMERANSTVLREENLTVQANAAANSRSSEATSNATAEAHHRSTMDAIMRILNMATAAGAQERPQGQLRHGAQFSGTTRTQQPINAGGGSGTQGGAARKRSQRQRGSTSSHASNDDDVQFLGVTPARQSTNAGGRGRQSTVRNTSAKRSDTAPQRAVRAQSRSGKQPNQAVREV
ncbi:hypothetical protein COOONC_05764 [Cooperia oncophora]